MIKVEMSRADTIIECTVNKYPTLFYILSCILVVKGRKSLEL